VYCTTTLLSHGLAKPSQKSSLRVYRESRTDWYFRKADSTSDLNVNS
jgi:hypothetical protein